MSRIERVNLELCEGGTEIHIDPKSFRLSGLKELLRHQIFSNSPGEINLISAGKKIIFSPCNIRRARKLSRENRQLFLNATACAMKDAGEIVILRRADLETNRAAHNVLDRRYKNVFKRFINSDPQLNYLDFAK